MSVSIVLRTGFTSSYLIVMKLVQSRGLGFLGRQSQFSFNSICTNSG